MRTVVAVARHQRERSLDRADGRGDPEASRRRASSTVHAVDPVRRRIRPLDDFFDLALDHISDLTFDGAPISLQGATFGFGGRILVLRTKAPDAVEELVDADRLCQEVGDARGVSDVPHA